MLKASEQTRISQDLIAQQAQIIENQQAQIALLQEQLGWLKKQLFGAKSERLVADLDQQSLPFAETELAAAAAEETEQISYTRRKSMANKGCDSLSYPEDLPVTRIELDVPEKEKVCAKTGEPLIRIGEEVTHKLARKAEQYYLIEYVRPDRKSVV